MDLTEIDDSSGNEDKLVLETLKNLLRNRGKEVFVSDWPVPYEYSARKRDYDKQAPLVTHKRALNEADGGEEEVPQSKSSKVDISTS